MSEEVQPMDAERALQDWIEERTSLDEAAALGASGVHRDPLIRLFAGAERAAPEMSDDEAARVLETVRAAARRGRSSEWSRSWRLLAAAATIVLALASAWLLQHHPTPPGAPARVVVREVFFEAKHEGKVVRLKMTVFRTSERQEEPHVAKPSL